MAVNRGKQFEDIIKDGLELVPEISVDRIHDQTTGFIGSSNICDFIVYKKPNIMYLECKSCHGNTLSISSNDIKHKYGAISNTQWEGLLKKSKIPGVVAGIIVWFIDHDKTVFIPIDELEYLRNTENHKSLNIKDINSDFVWYYEIPGRKKRVFFEYDMTRFFDEVVYDGGNV